MIRTVLMSATTVLAIAGGAASYAIDLPTTAQERRVDNRQTQQANRIGQGVASGEITQREQHRLQHQQNHIARLEGRVEADGTVTRKEALRLEKAQDRASRNIAQQKHDRQNQP